MASAGIISTDFMITSKRVLNTDSFNRVIDINVMGSVYVAKYASVAMSKNEPLGAYGERGAIIFVSSSAAYEGQRASVAYAASKAALAGLVLPMARDLGRFGIRAVSIAPSIFETPLGDGFPEKVREVRLSETPMKRFGDPKEFAHLVGSVVENTYVNGVTLKINGATKLSNL